MQVYLNSRGYSYDVHSLVKAFYPDENVRITEGDVSGTDDGICVFVSSGDIRDGMTVSGYVKTSAYVSGSVKEQSGQYENAGRAEVKNVLKRTLYSLLSDITQRALPWGTMTGIRPVKVARNLLAAGEDDDRIKEYMKSVYLCSDEKIAMACSIAHCEQKIIDSIPSDSYGLYVGIPFCPTTCMYCSFTSYAYALWKDRAKEYIDALKNELDLVSDLFSGRRANSVYIGGGTPTTLSADELFDLTGYIRKKLDVPDDCEFTVEAGRPDSITKEKLEALKCGRVSRISINPQTMNDKTLKAIGRRHTTEDVEKAYGLARAAGFTNINMDLILGLPGEDEKDVKYTFDRIREFAPDSLTVHSLAIKRASHMSELAGSYTRPGPESTKTMMETAHEAADDMGLLPYYLYRQKNIAGNLENVGFAREGCLCIYNIVMMEEVCDIPACGAGCISKRIFGGGRIERCDNVKDVSLYIEKNDEMIARKKKLFLED